MTNASTLAALQKQSHLHALVREYLLSSVMQFGITTSENIKLQASTLAQLTDTSSELTRTALMSISTRCFRLAQALLTISDQVSFDDVQIAANYIARCASQVQTVSALLSSS